MKTVQLKESDNPKIKKYFSIIDDFLNRKVLVIGDVMLDRYVWGEVTRISPEAPIPIVHIKKQTHVPGGAGNSAFNLAMLGAKVGIVGLVGNDWAKEELIADLGKAKIDTDGLIVSDCPTIIKQRVVSKDQHLLRMDYELNKDLDKKMVQEILLFIKRSIKKYDAIIISDYAKRINSETLMTEVIRLANAQNIVTVVDSKSKNYKIYKDATIFTPNHTDAAKITKIFETDEKSIRNIGSKLSNEINTTVVMTRGKDGISIFEKGTDPVNIPSKAKKVYDISGAGDTVASTLTLALACGADILEASELASYAAAVAIAKVGTATVSPDEIKEYIQNA